MSRLRRLGLLVAIWSVPAALMVAQAYIYENGPTLHALGRALAREATPWLVWIPATPVILRHADVGALRGWRLVGHIGFALAIGACFSLINGAISHPIRLSPEPTWWLEIEMSMFDWMPLQPLIYAGVLATGIALDGARRRRAAELGKAQLETQLAYAQLGALRAQLQPHFLFNTLNAAVALARAGDVDGTARVLVLLGELLRQLLRSDAPQEIPLRDELALLETYLEIQRVRFGERLQVAWAIDDDVRDALVPQLVLQPLVENALQHGIAKRTRAGQLAIRAARRGDQLELAVSDDGPGLAPGFSLDGATGVGLRNTRERLARLYGAPAALTLASAPGAQTTAAIALPLHREVAHG